MIDVNDESPQFEKPLYEFILTSDLKNFTIPAYIRAVDNDAEAPNNVVRYEITHGNYENKFQLNDVSGELTIRDVLTMKKSRNDQASADVIVLTARAFDLGVPVRFSTTTIRVYPPESRTRAVAFLVPGYDVNRQQLEDTLMGLTGGRVVIQDVKPYTGNLGSGKPRDEKSIVTATVIYDSDTVVDVAEIQKRLSLQSNDQGIIVHEDAVSYEFWNCVIKNFNYFQLISQNVYKAENRVLFWLLIILALLLAIGILTLLLCCICSWCPLYAASR
jgi:hypothetical protein